MKSILRFFLFVASLTVIVGILFLWRSGNLDESNHDSSVATMPEFSGPLTGLAALDRDFQNLIAKVKPSVVSITASSPSSRSAILRPYFGGSRALSMPPQLGSGVIVSQDGHILTNLHVVQGADRIEVQLSDGRTIPARLLGADPFTDVAVLAIQAGGLHPVAFSNSDQVRPGQIVFAIGNPYGLHETVTQGIISGIGRRSTSEFVNEFFQTDTAINPGNSGGPLINVHGGLIGLNNAIHSRNGAWQGISFAIPSNTARRVFEDIRDYGRVVRTWFGVVTVPPEALQGKRGEASVRGAGIFFTMENSPAEKSGIQPGDIIVEFNGKPVSDVIDLRNRVAETEVGQMIPVRLLREGRDFVVQVEMEPYPHS
jgi:serine protease Do